MIVEGAGAPTPPPARVLPTLSGLLLGLLVAMLATAIVSTSLPRIVADIGGDQTTLTWIVAGTLLAITVSTPIWGKLSDLLSRKALVIAALIFFIAGSLLSGFAPESLTLIAGRGLQGIGAGGLLSLVQIVLADIISPRDRGKYMGLFGAVTAVGTIGGPLLGGVVTDWAGWRWNFFGAVLVAVISLVIIAIVLPANARRRDIRIDYAGAALIAAGVSTLMIWVTLGGSAFEWLSWPSGLVLGSSLVFIAGAILVEARVGEPIIPLALFRNRPFVLTVLASISVGVATYGVAVFMSQYLQVSRGASPTDSGLIGLPQVIMVTLASTLVGAMISRTGRWKVWMASGAALQATGLGLLGTITTSTPIPLLWLFLAMVGWGIGSVMQNLVLMAENNVDARQLGVASASVGFFRTLGGTLGVAGLGAVIAWRSQSAFTSLAAQNELDLRSTDIGVLAGDSTLPAEVKQALADANARGIADAYIVAAVLAVITVICILLLPSAPLSAKTRSERLADLELETALASAGSESDRFLRPQEPTDHIIAPTSPADNGKTLRRHRL